jgi:hypothetical protein
LRDCLSRVEILREMEKILSHKPSTANRVLTLLLGLFSGAADAEEIPQDVRPVRGVTKYREEERERYLSSAELARLGDALREAETNGLP